MLHFFDSRTRCVTLRTAITGLSLNYGDCFSYALAKVSGQPLLFKGDNFARTDIRVVVAG